MKKLTAILLLIFTALSLFACDPMPADTTAKETGTAADTVTAPVTTAPETDITTDTVTDKTTDTVTDTVTDEATTAETTAEPAEQPAVYKMYDPMLTQYGYTATLTLNGNGSYGAVKEYTDRSSGFAVHITLNEKGVFDAELPEITLSAEEIELQIKFDTEDDRRAYLSGIDAAFNWGSMDKKTRDVLKAAAEGVYKGVASDISGVGKLTAGGKTVLDAEEDTVYLLVPGVMLSDDEYYITENGFILTLNGDGTCSMHCDTLKNDGISGPYILSDLYSGTYTAGGGSVTCVMTENVTKYNFSDEEAEREYRDYYTERYNGGSIGKVYYDYYMSLISDEGCVDSGINDRYVISVEEHTHTAIITEMPEN